MLLQTSQNILRKYLIKALPILLIFYFISFRSYFLLQHFFVQDVVTVGYFDVLKSGDLIKKAFIKIASKKDDSSQKLTFKNFVHEYQFLSIKSFALAFLLLAIIFYYKNLPKILSPPLSYQTRAPPAIC